MQNENCINCPAGKYSDVEGPGPCKTCEKGYEFDTLSTPCTKCALGKFQDQENMPSALCQMCPGGRYSDEEGLPICKLAQCSSGYNTVVPGLKSEPTSADCQPCTGDIASNIDKQKPGGDQGCEAGHFVCGNSCLKCPPGQHNSEGILCQQCHPGRYQQSAGETVCVNCQKATSELEGKHHFQFGSELEQDCLLCSGEMIGSGSIITTKGCCGGSTKPSCTAWKESGSTDDGNYEIEIILSDTKRTLVQLYCSGMSADINIPPTQWLNLPSNSDQNYVEGSFREMNNDGNFTMVTCKTIYERVRVETGAGGLRLSHLADTDGGGAVRLESADGTPCFKKSAFATPSSCNFSPAKALIDLTGTDFAIKKSTNSWNDDGYMSSSEYVFKDDPQAYFEEVEGHRNVEISISGAFDDSESVDSTGTCGYAMPNCDLINRACKTTIDCTNEDGNSVGVQCGEDICNMETIASVTDENGVVVHEEKDEWRCPQEYDNQGMDCGTVQLCKEKLQYLDLVFTNLDSVVSEASCPPLRSLFKCGGASSAYVCRTCPSGTFKNDLGFGCDTCQTGRIFSTSDQQCIDCPAGKRHHVETANCADCDAGKYGAASQQIVCSSCEIGKYQNIGGQTSCKVCPNSRYSNTVGIDSECTYCSHGQYQTEESSTACKDCPRGWHTDKERYSEPDFPYRDACVRCSAGFFNPYPKHGEECLECGTAIERAAVDCLGCPLGKRKRSGSDTLCDDCDHGTFTAQPASDMCSECPRGYHALPDKPYIGCNACSRGYYGDSTASTDFSTGCKQCKKGRYSDLDGLAISSLDSSDSTSQLPCKGCPKGTYSGATNVTKESSCKQCVSGRYNANIGASNSSQCSLCDVGKFSGGMGEIGEDACVKCSAGLYQSQKGRAYCLPCTHGTTQGESGKTECIVCAEGRFVDEKESTYSNCKLCPLGYYQPNKERATCLPCAPGSHQGTRGQGSCLSCESGRFMDTKISTASSCKACPFGFVQSKPEKASCFPCPRGKKQHQKGRGSCDDCPQGYYIDADKASVCKIAQVGRYVSLGSASIIQPPDGFFVTKCLLGEETAEAKGCREREKCAAGKYGTLPPSGLCSSCPAGWSSRKGVDSCQMCEPGKVAAEAESYKCSGCLTNTYQNREGQTSCSSCRTLLIGILVVFFINTTCILLSLTYSLLFLLVICFSLFFIISSCYFSLMFLAIAEGKAAAEVGSKKCSKFVADTSVNAPHINNLVPATNYGPQVNLTLTIGDSESITFNNPTAIASDMIVKWSSQKGFPSGEDTLQMIIPIDTINTQVRVVLRAKDETNPNNWCHLPGNPCRTSAVWRGNLYVTASYYDSETMRNGKWSETEAWGSQVAECLPGQYLRTHPMDNTCLPPLDLLQQTEELMWEKNENNPHINHTHPSCEPCMEGGSCYGPGTGILLWDIAPRRGWWRVDWAPPETPPMFEKCPRKAACIGVVTKQDSSFGTDVFERNDTVFGWSNTQFNYVQQWKCPAPHPAPRCETGSGGPVCSVCLKGYQMLQGMCVKCPPPEGRIIIIVVVVLVIILFVLIGKYMAKKFRKHFHEGVVDMIRDINRIIMIALSLAQINTAISVAIEIKWPENVLMFLAFFDFVNFDLVAITGAVCEHNVDFRLKFLVTALMPVIMVLYAIFNYWVGRARITLHINHFSKLTMKEQNQQMNRCFEDLFRLVDVDRSNTMSAEEFVYLLRLLGFDEKKQTLDELLAARLIQKLSGSIYARELSEKDFVISMHNGELKRSLQQVIIETSARKLEESEVKATAEKTGSLVSLHRHSSSRHNLKSRRKSLVCETSSDTELLRWNVQRKLNSESFSLAVQVLMLLHTPVSRKVFQYFSCHELGLTGSSWSKKYLRADYNISCNDLSYALFMPVVLVVLFGFTLLLPIAIGYQIFKYRHQLYQPAVLKTYGFLYDRLNKGVEFWEVHEIFRRMILTGLIIFFPENSTVRSCTALLVCIVAQMSLNYLQPHRNNLVFWVEQLGMAVAMFMYFISIILPVSLDEDLESLGLVVIAVNISFWVFVVVAIGLTFRLLHFRLGVITAAAASGHSYEDYRTNELIKSKGAANGVDMQSSLSYEVLMAERKKNSNLRLQGLSFKALRQHQALHMEVTSRIRKSVTDARQQKIKIRKRQSMSSKRLEKRLELAGRKIVKKTTTSSSSPTSNNMSVVIPLSPQGEVHQHQAKSSAIVIEGDEKKVRDTLTNAGDGFVTSLIEKLDPDETGTLARSGMVLLLKRLQIQTPDNIIRVMGEKKDGNIDRIKFRRWLKGHSLSPSTT